MNGIPSEIQTVMEKLNFPADVRVTHLEDALFLERHWKDEGVSGAHFLTLRHEILLDPQNHARIQKALEHLR